MRLPEPGTALFGALRQLVPSPKFAGSRRAVLVFPSRRAGRPMPRWMANVSGSRFRERVEITHIFVICNIIRLRFSTGETLLKYRVIHGRACKSSPDEQKKKVPKDGIAQADTS